MRVSIITPSFNSEKTIEETIKSVINQTYKDIEYIIIDGGSNDDTLKIISKYKNKISKIISEKDNGPYDAMNKGIRLSSGEVVGILNSDDFYASDDVICKIVNVFEMENCDCLWGDLVYVDRKNPEKIIRYWKSSEYREGLFQKGWHPPHPTFFVKKWVYEKYGVFDLSFPISADYELMLRFLEKYKIKGCYLPEVLVKMRVGGQSNRGILNIIKGNIECYRAWKVNGLKIDPIIFFLKPFSKVFQYFQKYDK